MPLTTLEADFARAMRALAPPPRLGLAVSGGSDSLALLHLAQLWGGAQLFVATVDHQLRPGSGAEAARVAAICAGLGVPHVTLTWVHSDRTPGNLQATARKARYALLRDWARVEGLGAVALGHTRDDQAETVLMRLARGSGVDGLAAMAPAREEPGLRWLRPLLETPRAVLRDWLRAQGHAWVDDPSNDDTRFARIRVRQAMGALGLDAERLAQTAMRMQAARQVLDAAAHDAALGLCQFDRGDIVIDAQGFDALPAETRLRLLSAGLCEIASQPYRPRLRALHESLEARRISLHGCLITRSPRRLRLSREPQAVAGHAVPLGTLWDNRWQIVPPAETSPSAPLIIRALGTEGIALCPRRTPGSLPHASLLASPAVWQGDHLIAAPLAGMGKNWRLAPRKPCGVLREIPNLR